jgi:drug/metabolite transporter, DME family
MQKEYLFIIITGILSGFIIFGGQVFTNLGLSLFEIAVLPYSLTLIFLLPFLFKKKYRFDKKLLPILILYGIISAFLVIAQFGGIVLGVPVAMVVLLLYTQPLWTILIGKLFLKEKLTLVNILAVILVLIGILVLVNPLSAGFYFKPGILVALSAGVFISLWVVVGSVLSKRGSHPIATKYAETLFMIIFLLLIYPLVVYLIKDHSLISFSLNWPLKVWIYIILFNLFTQVLGHLLFFYGLKKVPATAAGVILLLEPVVAAILAALFLGQALTWNIIVGGIIILMANYIVIVNGDKNK